MKTARQIFLGGMALILAGCATGQTGWDTQMGRLTYDQAVSKLGPPARQEKLPDGRTVAEWVSCLPATSPGMDNDFRYHSASFGSDTTRAGNRESKLSLTFDTNNVLTDWAGD